MLIFVQVVLFILPNARSLTPERDLKATTESSGFAIRPLCRLQRSTEKIDKIQHIY